ncbi:MAG: HPr(Ser) kinase/phosphatase [Spirochaetes bacterium]|nr:HPr(Ser) kinase/phosphatase [Spirochaetota bacterium]
MKKQLRIRDILENTQKIDLQLILIAGREGLDKAITAIEINRPGLTLAGFFDYFAYDRIQIFGLGETAYIKQLSRERREEIYSKFFSYGIVCCVYTHNEYPDEVFIEYAQRYKVPTFVTQHPTTRFISLLTHIVEAAFAESVTIHGTLVDVFGIGILLIGKSGVGKSEAALELIERGHRLVADDMVEIKKIDESLLMGSGSELIRHHMEIRGIGILNVRDIFGIRSVRNRKRIELVAELQEWDPTTHYDRLGIEEQVYTILDIEVPYIVVPVRPGRNIPIIIETAALNQRLKKMGIFSAQELDRKIQEWIARENNSK